ncbi:MAG: hypothetical protein JXX28_00885 [Deltaproteobacteria bacterium]|nr:hypothetical protein [Deltaproteobacteria bacterium]
MGSLLHTLHLPLSGFALATLGSGLLVAQRQLLPERGATLATGLVAALAKSVSPAGIILGPMVGIAVEALLVELALLPAPRSRALAVVAVTLAASWALSQRLLMTVALYGEEVVSLYLAGLRDAAAFLGLPEEARWVALGALLALVLGAGVLGGSAGHAVGRRAAARLAEARA